LLRFVENGGSGFQAIPRDALFRDPSQTANPISPEISGPINRPFTVGLDILIVLVRNMGFG